LKLCCLLFVTSDVVLNLRYPVVGIGALLKSTPTVLPVSPMPEVTVDEDRDTVLSYDNVRLARQIANA